MLVIKYKFIILFVFLLSSLAMAEENQKKELNKLFKNLINISTTDNAELIEKKIWSVWHKHPKNQQLTERLELGTQLMIEGNYNYALKIFNNIISTDPKWSEGWNKRATLYFLMNNLTKSLRDIENVLNIEPRHFGALSGQARIYIRLEEYEKAINSLEKVIKFYPLFNDSRN